MMMTHPSDIAGLSDLLLDLREGPMSFHDARTKMLRAATALDSLSARVKELEVAYAMQNDLLALQAQQITDCRTINDAAFAHILRAEQQRDEAVSALKPFSDVTAIEVAFSTVANKLYRLDYRATFETQLTFKHFKDANEIVRRLASGPEGGAKP